MHFLVSFNTRRGPWPRNRHVRTPQASPPLTQVGTATPPKYAKPQAEFKSSTGSAYRGTKLWVVPLRATRNERNALREPCRCSPTLSVTLVITTLAPSSHTMAALHHTPCVKATRDESTAAHAGTGACTPLALSTVTGTEYD